MPETKRTQKKGAEFNEYIATGNGNLNKWYYETFISLKASAARRHSMTADVKIIQYNIFPFKKNTAFRFRVPRSIFCDYRAHPASFEIFWTDVLWNIQINIFSLTL